MTGTAPRSFRSVFPLVAVMAALAWGGCAHVPAHRQRLVAKPATTLGDRETASYRLNLWSALEPGTASVAGATASGCTSCR